MSAVELTFFHAPGPNGASSDRLPIIGVPFDGLSTERRGSADGPNALRRASRSIGQYRVSTGSHIDWPARLVDLGDVPTNRFELYDHFPALRCTVEGAMNRHGRVLTVGGDHSLTYGAVTAAAAIHPDLRLIQIDAHHDATDPEQWRCRFNHGTFVRNLIEDGVLEGPDVFQVGIRDFQWRDSGARYLQQHGAHCWSAAAIDEEGLKPALEALRAEPERPTYLTFDIDSIDPAFAPGTGEHMTGGLTAREATWLVRQLFDGSVNIVAADLVEVAPGLDPSGRTVALGAHLLGLMADGLSGPAKQTRAAGNPQRGTRKGTPP